MDSFSVVKDKVACQLLVKEYFIMNDIKIVVNKLLLNCPVVSLNNSVDLRTARIREKMGNSIFSKLFVRAVRVKLLQLALLRLALQRGKSYWHIERGVIFFAKRRAFRVLLWHRFQELLQKFFLESF